MLTASPSGPPLRSPLARASIDKIWVAVAQTLGWTVMRGGSAYASTDGTGNMLIGVPEILDTDDALAQLVFHELCHGVVQGPAGWGAADWGLCNGDDRDLIGEQACLRVQVFLAERHGLRELMAPTTEYRAYHDQIAGDPLRSDSDPAAGVARAAVERPVSAHWIAALEQALLSTRRALDAWGLGEAPVDGAEAIHPVGLPFADNGQSCGTCAWHYVGGRGRGVERCRQTAGEDGNGRRTASRFRACVRWEPTVDCLTCGACCREAYHSVTVSVRDPVVWKQPHLVVRNGHRFEILRAGDRCAALRESGETNDEPRSAPLEPGPSSRGGRRFSCEVYDDRPRTCREFEAGGRHCLVARRRVGLSP